ncbi:MAG: hypothetical protein ABI797_07355 [Chloroflexota bacterium]
MILAAPRGLVSAAFAAPAERTDLWLLGTLSFCLRGGALLLLAPIIVLPTQVEVRLALGANLGSSGLTPGFWTLFGVATLVTSLLALAALHGLARIEARAFIALTGEARGRPGLVTRLFIVQALTLIALLVVAVPLAASIGQATLDEILRPSGSGSIYIRVLAQILPVLVVTAAFVPVIDTISAFTARELLLGRPLRDSLRAGLSRLIHAPARSVGAALVAWLSLGLIVLTVCWALTVAWQATRAAFLASTSVSDLLARPDSLVVALLLTAVFVSGLALCGLVAAFRAALWTLASVRH